MYNADLYQENNCVQQKIALECFEKYGKLKWKKDNNIIDIGSGEGTVINKLKLYFPRNAILLGSDISEDMVTLANKRYTDEKTSFTVLDIVGDIKEYMKRSFTHVFSTFALNWVKDQRRAFDNIFELLQPDGECFLIIVTKSPVFDVYRSLVQNNKWKPWLQDIENHISPYNDMQDPKKEVTDMMKMIGFDNLSVEHEDVMYTFDSIKALKKTLEAINPFIIPSEKKNDYWKDYLTEWKKFTGVDNNYDDIGLKHFIMKFKSLIIHGHKPADKKRK